MVATVVWPSSLDCRQLTGPTGFPHVRSAICAPMGGERSGVGVAGGGDAEQVEDLLLERVEVGLEGLDVVAVAA